MSDLRFGPSPYRPVTNDEELDRELVRHRRAAHGTHERWMSGCDCDACEEQHKVVSQSRRQWKSS